MLGLLGCPSVIVTRLLAVCKELGVVNQNTKVTRLAAGRYYHYCPPLHCVHSNEVWDPLDTPPHTWPEPVPAKYAKSVITFGSL